MALSRLLLLRRLNFSQPLCFRSPSQIPNSLHFSTAADSTPQSPSAAKPTSLSARMDFIFQQIDEIDKDREEKDNTLQRIRAWRESKKLKEAPIPQSAPDPPASDSMTEGLKSELAKSEALLESSDEKKEVELVHPWPEWIELMERLLQQNYFDYKRKDEVGMMQGLGFDFPESAEKEDIPPDFSRNFRSVQAAMVNFGRDRFDILRALSRQDLQLLVGYGCPSPDKKVAYSGKLLRKHVHLNEGDVCSSCSLRGSCEKAYLLTNKEDEARTIDVMRILLAYGFDPIDGSLANKSLLKMKPVKTVVRKLLHQVVKLSAVPIDPNLPPPIIKRPPPKVKQPPPPPKKRVGRDDIEMKKGDWLCPKCEFMNFAKNTVCLQCDAKRPKRQLLPGEWECPQMDKKPVRTDVSNAWNFDFDDNESDGADVAAFEYADSRKLDEDFPLSQQTHRESSRGHENGSERSRSPRGFEMEYSDSTSMRHGVGFNDFDEDEDNDDVDSYELVPQNDVPKTSRVDLSEFEADSESEDLESSGENWQFRGKSNSQTRGGKSLNCQAFSDYKDTEVDFDTDDDLPVHPNWKSSHVADVKQQKRGRNSMSYGSDDDFDFNSGSDNGKIRSKNRGNRRGSNRLNFTRDFDESFSERDDELSSYKSDRQTDKRGQNRPGGDRRGLNRMNSTRNLNVPFSESDSDDDRRRYRQRDGPRGGGGGRGRNAKDGNKRGGGSTFSKGGRGRRGSYDDYQDEDRQRRPRMNARDGNFRGNGRGGGSTFSKGGGRPDSFDDYQGEETQWRPRINARDGKFQGNRQGGKSTFNKSGGRRDTVGD